MADKKISQLTSATTPLAGTEVLPIVQGGSTVKVAVSDLTAGRNVSMVDLTTTGNTTLGNASTDTLNVGNGDLVKDASGNTGVGIASPAARLHVVASNALNEGAAAAVIRQNGSSGNNGIVVDVTNTPSNYVADFRIGNVSAVRVEPDGNVTIGTAGKGIDFSANTGAAGETSSLLNWYEEGTWTPAYTNTTPPTTPYTMTVASATYTRIGRQVTVRAWIYTQNVDTTGAAGALKISGLPFTSAASSAGYSAMAIGQARQWVTAPCYGYVDGTEIVLMYRADPDADDDTLTAAGLTTGAAANKNQLMFTATYFV